MILKLRGTGKIETRYDQRMMFFAPKTETCYECKGTGELPDEVYNFRIGFWIIVFAIFLLYCFKCFKVAFDDTL